MVSGVRVTSSRVPEGFAGFRIAQISDLHNTEFGTGNQDLLRRIAETEPEIIVITGDLVDSRRTDKKVAVDFVRAARKIAPVYYANGNHEARIADYAEFRAALVKAGAVVLEEEAVSISRNGDTLTLLGLPDPNFAMVSGLHDEISAMVGARLDHLLETQTGYTILLSHRPELFATYVQCGVDLVFSGHAHGGQFRLPLIGGLVAPDQGLFPRYDAGRFVEGQTNMIVSRGLGNSIIPLRFNNRPEIVLVELQPR